MILESVRKDCAVGLAVEATICSSCTLAFSVDNDKCRTCNKGSNKVAISLVRINPLRSFGLHRESNLMLR